MKPSRAWIYALISLAMAFTVAVIGGCEHAILDPLPGANPSPNPSWSGGVLEDDCYVSVAGTHICPSVNDWLTVRTSGGSNIPYGYTDYQIQEFHSGDDEVKMINKAGHWGWYHLHALSITIELQRVGTIVVGGWVTLQMTGYTRDYEVMALRDDGSINLNDPAGGGGDYWLSNLNVIGSH